MYISIDMGGTNTRVASSKNLTEILKAEKFTTKEDLLSQKQALSKAVRAVASGEEITYICLGVPGLIDKAKNKFGEVLNYRALSNLEYTSILDEDLHNGDIIGENDAALAGLGEAVYGAGKNFASVGYITISTGVGGIRIPNNRLDLTQRYSEPGHHVINIGGPRDTKVNLYGTLDAYVSGKAFELYYGIKPEECTDPAIWEEYAEKLSVGLLNIMCFWAPDIIIIGGGISNKFDQFIKEPLIKNLSKQDFLKIPEIKKAELGDNSGLLGGFALINQVQ